MIRLFLLKTVLSDINLEPVNSEMTVQDTNTPIKKDNAKKSVRRKLANRSAKEQQQDTVKQRISKLKLIKEKLDKVLLVLPEFDHLKARVANSKRKNIARQISSIHAGKHI